MDRVVEVVYLRTEGLRGVVVCGVGNVLALPGTGHGRSLPTTQPTDAS